MLSRRHFLQTALAAVLADPLSAAGPKRAPRILLRSSWQVVNIGDIAHTPGVLALIEKHIPQAEVILWASGDLSEEVIAMEHKRFPKLKVVKGRLGTTGKASSPELEEAVEWADFFLHGSGPGLVGGVDLQAFEKRTGKPFGIYGITYSSASPAIREMLSRAKFFYFRDSVSLAKAKEDGIKAPIMEFGPDGAFAVDLRHDEPALAFLKANALEEGKFLCCIPRLRNTPYWTIKAGRAFDAAKHARNEAMKEHDCAPLRAAIEGVVRETQMKVLLCPEDMTQMAVAKENLYDKLPEEVKKRVVWRERFWLTDEALSTYLRSAGLFGHEMHSPIMCIGNGVPAIVCRWAEQTSKGYMWRDIGLGEWLFDFDKEEEIARMPAAVVAMAKEPAAARVKAAKAHAYVQERQRITMAELARHLPA
jgi:polysaccharide pyruvyl transferase WcaK-like protein